MEDGLLEAQASRPGSAADSPDEKEDKFVTPVVLEGLLTCSAQDTPGGGKEDGKEGGKEERKLCGAALCSPAPRRTLARPSIHSCMALLSYECPSQVTCT